MTNYCETLRQVAAAREEVPGRRGYPGYMYTDLATIYERAGVVKDVAGSITLIPILTLPGDDITHPIPDLTGYVTEGQVTVSRELHNKGIYPPIDVLKSLSRLGSGGIGSGKTREDHKDIVNQMFSLYAAGIETKNLSSIVGEESLGDSERQLLDFAESFEDEFLRQGRNENRSVDATLDLCWKLLGKIPKSELKRIRPEFLKKYYKPAHPPPPPQDSLKKEGTAED
jgi:V/A-type H+-transporting ATPase subunit B